MKRSRVRLLLAFALIPMPSALKRIALGLLIGAHIDSSARIGLSMVDSDALDMGPGSRIGHFTVFRGLRRTRLGAGARVGNFNWITAATVFRSQATETSEHGCFTLGRESAISGRHYIDCSGGVIVGEYSSLGGVGSSILSHQVNFSEGIQTAETTRIGDRCFVSSNVCVVAGASIPSRSIVAMGAVVVGRLEHSGSLYGGVPARELRTNVDTGRWFRRTRGFVGLTNTDQEDDDLDSREA